jgi:catechol-2,3-dioxygenase
MDGKSTEARARIPEPNDEIHPAKMSHITFATHDKKRLVDWYCHALGAQVVFENDLLSFLTFDDEHHRMAIIDLDNLPEGRPDGPGLHHFAFNLPTMGELAHHYEKMKAAGNKPHWVANHGMNVAFYYDDPDGNTVEFHADPFATAVGVNEWFAQGAFDRNTAGAEFDPDELLQKVKDGVPESELRKPWTELDWVEPIKPQG